MVSHRSELLLVSLLFCVVAEEIEDLTQENKRLTAQVKADRRLREQHASLLAKSKAAREQAAVQAARATALEEELAQLNAKVLGNPSLNVRLEKIVVANQ